MSRRSDTILSHDEIDFPELTQPNILVCLTQEAYKSLLLHRPAGWHRADLFPFCAAGQKVDAKQFELPLYEEVMTRIGKPIVFNICVLGALVGLTGLIKLASLLTAIKDRVPREFLELNTRAFKPGPDMGTELSMRRWRIRRPMLIDIPYGSTTLQALLPRGSNALQINTFTLSLMI